MDKLDPRADNYFNYDKEAEAWVIATTWHINLHKLRTPKDKYEVRHFRAARRFDTEPTNDEIAEFATQAKAGLDEFIKVGVWSGDVDDDGNMISWQFNRAYVKDLRGGING